MNTQVFYIRSDDRDAVIDLIALRLSAPADAPGQQPSWGLQSSYDVWLAGEPKRKVAVSAIREHWIAAVESKEVLDFALLQAISLQLNAEVVACQLAGTIDAWGCARCMGGQVTESEWHEDDADPLDSLRQALRRYSIPHDIVTFREVVRVRDSGWTTVQGRRAG